MGTRSLTYVYDEMAQPVMCMYRQSDGYLTGHGRAISDFLSSLTMVNGISFGEKRKVANGMGCLAAQMVARFKVGAGGIYLHPTELNQDSGQEYEYHIFTDNIVVKDPVNVIFDGTWEDFELHIINEEQTTH